MARPRRPVHDAPRAAVAKTTPHVTETPVDFDLELNACDDPDAGFVYVEAEPPDDMEARDGLPQRS
ncbi:MAG: hypothetical protein CFE40_05085 [Burkholderiales bacterium PBB1]|nr:MAG: hypothetical protein CFE40_05085 [Burkholderiales bacterium PBB1]